MAVKINFNKYSLFTLSLSYEKHSKSFQFVFLGLSIVLYLDRSYFDLYNCYVTPSSIEKSGNVSQALDVLMDFFWQDKFASDFMKYVKKHKLFKKEITKEQVEQSFTMSGAIIDEEDFTKTVKVHFHSYLNSEFFNDSILEELKLRAIDDAKAREEKTKESFKKLKWYQKVFGYRLDYETDIST